MNSITFSKISVFGNLGRTDSETFLGGQINDRGCGVIVGGDRYGRDLLSKRIIKVLMEFSINNSRGKILSYSHSICTS